MAARGPNTDAQQYSHSSSSNNGLVPSHSLQHEYFNNDLREYYAQLNFTDNFSARIGKQQVIWSEADALSGTEVTNPVNAHGTESTARKRPKTCARTSG